MLFCEATNINAIDLVKTPFSYFWKMVNQGMNKMNYQNGNNLDMLTQKDRIQNELSALKRVLNG